MDRLIRLTTAQLALNNALWDLKALDAREVTDATWQDVAGTAAVNLRCVAKYLEQCRHGHGSEMLDTWGIKD